MLVFRKFCEILVSTRFCGVCARYFSCFYIEIAYSSFTFCGAWTLSFCTFRWKVSKIQENEHTSVVQPWQQHNFPKSSLSQSGWKVRNAHYKLTSPYYWMKLQQKQQQWHHHHQKQKPTTFLLKCACSLYPVAYTTLPIISLLEPLLSPFYVICRIWSNFTLTLPPLCSGSRFPFHLCRQWGFDQSG